MNLRVFPDPILAKKCEDVEIGDTSVISILDEMLDKLHELVGAGLAAPQVGILKKLVVIDIPDYSDVYKMINPKIIWRSEEMTESKEGCLSLPGMRDTVWRHERVKVEYYDTDFNKQIVEGEEFLAYCFQHELDHLEGTLYIDHLSRLKRNRFISKYKKLMESENEQ